MRHERTKIIEAMADAIDRDLPGMVFSDQVVEGLRAAAERGYRLAKLPAAQQYWPGAPDTDLANTEGWNACLDAIETIDIGESE